MTDAGEDLKFSPPFTGRYAGMRKQPRHPDRRVGDGTGLSDKQRREEELSHATARPVPDAKACRVGVSVVMVHDDVRSNTMERTVEMQAM